MQVYKEYFKKRNSYIDELKKGKIDKNLFLSLNLALYGDSDAINLNPTISSMEEGVYFYQFHNLKAKLFSKNYIENKGKEHIYALECKHKSDFHYEQKEFITLKMLNMFVKQKDDISAYFIYTKSKRLDSKLLEIVFTKFDSVILHSLDKKVYLYLQNKGFLEKYTRISKINNYVNTRYF